MNWLSNKIFKITSGQEFEEICLEIFKRQATYCSTYKEYLELVGCNPGAVTSTEQIPFLPIGLFKSKKIITLLPGSKPKEEAIFLSSATTGMTRSKHYITDLEIYRQSFSRAFNHFYGDAGQYAILALLPSYLEREGSSLVYMAEHLIKASGNSYSGFYLYNHQDLADALISLKQKGQKCILLGVTFALLDFVQNYQISFPELIVIETGGMKGRGKEIERGEMHKILCKGFGVNKIHSEYGMAELLSQAYSKGDGIFYTPHWMKIIIRDLYNPFKYLNTAGTTGGINIIDLANINSCSFIETEDMGRTTQDGGFEILGRLKEAELRGCNMLLE